MGVGSAVGPMAIIFARLPFPLGIPAARRPCRSAGITRLFVTHMLGALILSFAWAEIGNWYARALATSPSFAGLDVRYDSHFGIIVVSGVLLDLIIVGFFYVLIAIEASRAAEAQVLETSVLARDAELKALKAQVNPHFLVQQFELDQRADEQRSRARRGRCASCWRIFCG